MPSKLSSSSNCRIVHLGNSGNHRVLVERVGLAMHQPGPTTEGRTVHREVLESVADLIQPVLDLLSFGGILFASQFDPGLNLADRDAGEMEIGGVDALKPSQASTAPWGHGLRNSDTTLASSKKAIAYSSTTARRRTPPHGGTRSFTRASGAISSFLRLGLAAACRRCHGSIGTSTAAISASADAYADDPWPGTEMRTTVTLDDHLLARAQELCGSLERTALLREALQALVERESARRLAALAGSQPDLQPIPRRRSGA